ncbi:hypothetical protein ACOBQX_18285 [Actinokineospora sp. G85]
MIVVAVVFLAFFYRLSDVDGPRSEAAADAPDRDPDHSGYVEIASC